MFGNLVRDSPGVPVRVIFGTRSLFGPNQRRNKQTRRSNHPGNLEILKLHLISDG